MISIEAKSKPVRQYNDAVVLPSRGRRTTDGVAAIPLHRLSFPSAGSVAGNQSCDRRDGANTP